MPPPPDPHLTQEPNPAHDNKLTAEQIESLQKQIRRSKKGYKWLAAVALAAFVLASGIFWYLQSAQGQALDSLTCALPFGAVAALFCVLLNRSHAHTQEYEEDIRVGVLQTVEVRIVWRFLNYGVQAQERVHLTIPENPLPGRYRFQCLPCSRFALDGEWIGTYQESYDIILDALMRVRRFDASDLEANRTRVLSARQKRSLKSRISFALAAMGISYVLFPLLLTALYFAQGAIVVPDSGPEGGLLSCVGCISIALLAPLPVTARTLVRLVRFYRKDCVNVVEGIGLIHVDPPRWTIAHLTFPVSNYTRRALVKGLEYRAYYLEGTTRLLSLEPVRKPGISETAKPPEPRRALADEYLLALNRAGRLGPEQLNTLMNYWLRSVVPTAIGLIIGMTVLSYLLWQFDLEVPFLLWLVLFAGTLYGIARVGNRDWFPVLRDLLGRQVRWQDGPLRRVASSDTHDLYRSGMTIIPLSRALRQDPIVPVVSGKWYRVYYLAHSNLLINIEPLEEQDLPVLTERAQ